MKNIYPKEHRYFPYFHVSIKGNYFLLVSKSGVRERFQHKNAPLATESIQFPTLHFAAQTKHVRGQKVAILSKKCQYWLCSPEIPGTESIFDGEQARGRQTKFIGCHSKGVR
jgi:hypothetical protein